MLVSRINIVVVVKEIDQIENNFRKQFAGT